MFSRWLISILKLVAGDKQEVAASLADAKDANETRRRAEAGGGRLLSVPLSSGFGQSSAKTLQHFAAKYG